ncbi:hypothetical protein KXR87_13430 [Yokenella regensburgei]|uniref:hypothetical protein n=1 Tax=Yokenella regensburgei TaxID=158877 RepID=UPI003F15D107
MVYSKMKSLIYKGYALIYIFLIFTGAIYFKEYYMVYRNLIAVTWGDGPYGKAMYGVYVYTGAKKKGTVEIKLRIYTGRQDFYFISYYRDFGVIGMVDNKNELDAWSDIVWQTEGVRIGKEFFISKKILGEHR